EPDLRGFEWRHLYHLTNSNVIRRWRGHADQILRIVWPKGADWFATSGHYGDVKFWNGTTGDLEGRIQTDKISVWGLATSNDGSLLVGGLHNGYVVVWDTLAKKEIRRFRIPGTVKAVAISADNRLIAAGSSIGAQPIDGWIKLWDWQNSRTVLEER